MLVLIISFLLSKVRETHCGEAENFRLKPRERIFAVFPLSNEVCWAVGPRGLVIKTLDGGKTWNYSKCVDSDLPFNDIFFVGKRGWIVGKNGLILQTQDSGSTWKVEDKVTEASLMKLCCLDESHGFAVGEYGVILWRGYEKPSWQEYPFDWFKVLSDELILKGVTAVNLYDIFFVNETLGWIVGDNGLVLKSSDGGQNWRAIRIGSFPPLFSVFFKNELEGWATGQNGLLLRTNDGGDTWSSVELDADGGNLYSLRMEKDYGYIVGDKGTVLKTTDGGATWSKVVIDLPSPFTFFADAWLVSPNSSPSRAVLMGEHIIEIIP